MKKIVINPLKQTMYICFSTRIPEPLCLASLGLEGIESCSFTFDSFVAHYIVSSKISEPLCLASLGLVGFDSCSFTFASLAAHYICFSHRISESLCLNSLGLKEIGSSLFTFDSLMAHYICFPQDSKPALPRFSWAENWKNSHLKKN